MSPEDGETVHVVVNPVSGSGQAPAFYEEILKPLLEQAQIPYVAYTTESGNPERTCHGCGVAVRQSFELARKSTASSSRDAAQRASVIVLGGDGTAHEFMEGYMEESTMTSGGRPEQDAMGRVDLVLVPCGTANALYHCVFPDPKTPPKLSNAKVQAHLAQHVSDEDQLKLLSILLFLDKQTSPRRLPLTRLEICPNANSSSPKETHYTHVVLSTSLHAALLHDSEKLRETVKGLERFAIAAKQNLPVAFGANVKFHGQVRQYDPSTQSFAEPFTIDKVDGTYGMNDLFSYFLTTTTVDRLEPTFIVAPTLTRIPSSSNRSIEIVILRPQRNPVVAKAMAEDQASGSNVWAEKVGEVFGWVYQGGKHIDLTYAPNGDLEHGGNGKPVVEVFRIEDGSFEWIPRDATHSPSHLVCADGAIHTIPPEGKLRAQVMPASADTPENGVYLHA